MGSIPGSPEHNQHRDSRLRPGSNHTVSRQACSPLISRVRPFLTQRKAAGDLDSITDRHEEKEVDGGDMSAVRSKGTRLRSRVAATRALRPESLLAFAM